MSRPMNMLRTRRKDNNVKPNRRLDRKSSRGMLYENEELRLKTININAEVESRQSDIKKLKRENEMLKKGLWYLRDEYDKLEKLIKDKKIDFSSSSTCSTSNDSDSCSSCSEESEEVEAAQNMKNVQKTNLRNIQDQFEQLSVVTEETSAENSEPSLTRDNWNKYEDNVIQPDQSYPPIYRNPAAAATAADKDNDEAALLSPPMMRDDAHFFAPIDPQRFQENHHFSEIRENVVYHHHHHHPPLYGADRYVRAENENVNLPPLPLPLPLPPTPFQHAPNCERFLSNQKTNNNNNSNHFYQNMVLVPQTQTPKPQTQAAAKNMEKSLTDLIVKIDNQNFDKGIVFSNTPSQSTFSNGGNLEELLNDIESISQRGTNNHHHHHVIHQEGLYRQNEVDAEAEDVAATRRGGVVVVDDDDYVEQHSINEKPYKSELNVVLVPSPMPLITLDKYKNIQRSFENVNSRPIEELSVSQQDLCLIPPPTPIPKSHSAEPLIGVGVGVGVQNMSGGNFTGDTEKNPFFFGNLKDNYVNGNFFNTQYNPDGFLNKTDDKKQGKMDLKFGSKMNLLDVTSSEQISSENEENLKFKTTSPTTTTTTAEEKKSSEQTKESKKSPISIRKKVSIHFKGKSKKNQAQNGSDSSTTATPAAAAKTPSADKHSLFDIRFGGGGGGGENKDKAGKNSMMHQKTPSIESKKSTTETSNQEAKTPTSSDSKTSNEKKPSSISGSAKRDQTDKKLRKSVSISPERSKHVHVAEEGGGVKKHKKHKKCDRGRQRRQTSVAAAAETRGFRERSYSVCTDRSAGGGLEHRLGLGLGLGLGSGFLFDDVYSERGERTNSLSSCDTAAEHARKMSALSNVPLSGKVPWCGCWGNGCL